MLKEEFEKKLIEAESFQKNAQKADSENTPPRSDWGRDAFSTKFSCHFCGEIFKRDCNYTLHLQIQHKDESEDTIKDLINDVEHYKLDGSEFSCNICGGKYAQHSSFMRHARNHGVTFKEYVEIHGNPETSSSEFECRLCGKSMKRTRNIITTHMKHVHGYSWTQYRDKTSFGVKMEPESDPLDDSTSSPLKVSEGVEMFECVLCDSRVKGRKQHLTRIHNIDPEVYQMYVNKRQMGEQVPDLVNCKMCNRLCFELEKHVKLAHKIDFEEYELMEDQERSTDGEYSCYVSDCSQRFKKEADLLVHIDIKHANEDEKEKMKVKNSILRKSEASKISSKLLCKICGASYSSRSSLWGHVTRTHSLTWQDYETSYGHVEDDIETLEPFQCKICEKNIKNERNVIVRHVKGHGLNWKKYVENYVKNNNFVQQQEQGDKDLVKNVKISPVLKTPPGPPTIIGIIKLENQSENSLNNHTENSSKNQSENSSKYHTENSSKNHTENSFKNHTEHSKKKSSASSKNEDFMVASKLMNVTDKGLKTCTRCKIDFPSRLRFIRHCQLTHKMKFKLKNGDKLVLP